MDIGQRVACQKKTWALDKVKRRKFIKSASINRRKTSPQFESTTNHLASLDYKFNFLH